VNSIRHTLFVLYVAAMLMLFLVPLPTLPIPAPNQFDKVVHFGIYLGFALLLHLDRRPKLWLTLSVSLAFAGGIELMQSLLAYRSGDWRDFLAGAAGAGVGVALAMLVAPKPAVAATVRTRWGRVTRGRRL
jgi:VanZ family protein